MRIAVIADVSPSLGVGHASRSFVIAKHLASLGHEVNGYFGPIIPEWLMQKIESEETVNFRLSNGFEFVDAGKLSEEFILVDSPVIDDTCNYPKRALMIRDTVSNIPNHLTVQPVFEPLRLERTSNAPFRGGREYIIIDPELAELKHRINRAEKSNAAVMVGGADPLRNIEFIAHFLSNFDSEYTYHFFVPAKSWLEVNKTLSASKLRHRVFPLSSYVHNNLIEMEFVITAAGVTMYELMFLGIPILVFPNVKSELKLVNMFNRTGLALTLPEPYLWSKQVQRVHSNIRFMESRHKRRDLKAAELEKLVDGFGVNRVAEFALIESLKFPNCRTRC